MPKKAYYDFKVGSERQRFVEDTYKFWVTYCDFEEADYNYYPETGIYLVQNGPKFLHTMAKLYHDGIRLIPIVADFEQKIGRTKYFQFKDAGKKLEYHDKITIDLEDYVMCCVENWVLTGKYEIVLTGEMPKCFHAHCLELLYRGIHYVPKGFRCELGKKPVLELEFCNYYGPTDKIYHP
jgi:hypothetical protein